MGLRDRPRGSFGAAPVVRGGALLALLAFAAVDGFLITLAVHHSRSRSDNAVVAVSTRGPAATPSTTGTRTTPSAAATAPLSAVAWTPDGVALSSYGACPGGYATVNGRRVTGVRAVLAATGPSGALLGLDKNCKPALLSYDGTNWRLSSSTVPSGVVAAATSALWVIGADGSLVVDAKGATVGHPKKPCTSTQHPTFVVAISAKVATLFCTAPPTSAGQVRLVYGTTDGGATWAEYSGARTVGPGASGRKDGLDGDGALVAVASLGGDVVGVLLSDSGCDGLQLRTSKDRGRNWVVGGCLPPAVVADGVALGGTSSSVRVGSIAGGALTTYTSTDGGKTWTS